MSERILMTTDTVGGVFSYALTAAAELAARGHEVHLATMGPPPRAEQRVRVRAVEGIRLHESSFALEWMDEPWRSVDAAGEWLLGLSRDVDATVIHLNGYAHGAVRFEVPKIIVAHSCVLSWYESVLGSAPPPRFSSYAERVREGLAGAQRIVAVSNDMRAALKRHYDPATTIDVVYNGVPAAQLTGAGQSPFVLACGRAWDRAKNVGALARIAPCLPWPVRVAGWEVEESGLQSLGWLDPVSLGTWMERAPIFALPVRYEPFGLSALEAAQRFTALVLGDIPSQREIWGDAALYVDDDASLCRAITRLTWDDVQRVDLAMRAEERAERYSAARMVDAMLDIYGAARGARACA